MYRTPALAFFIFIQVGLMVLGIKTNPVLMIGLPIIVIFTIWLIYNPGASLLLLALTGIIKGFLINIIPVFEVIDYTLLFAILIWIGLFRLYFIGKWRIPEWSKSLLGLYSLFCIILFFSGFYTPSPDYGWQKIMRFIVFNSTMFITPFIIINNIGDSKRVLLWFRNILIVFGAIMFGYILYFLAISSGISFLIRVSILGANPITVASFLAIAAGMMMVLMVRSNMKNWILYLPILTLLLVGLIMTGSRGPIISLLLGSIFYLVLFEKEHRKRIILLGTILVFLLLVIMIILPENFTTRYLDYTTGDLVIQRGGVKRVSTVAMRMQYWELCILEWLSSAKSFFIGVGSGGFSSFYILRDYRFYPHNMFFEVLLELGIVGFTVLIMFWYKCYYAIIQYKKNIKISMVSAMWIITAIIRFLGAQFSGDISGNRVAWLFVALALVSICYEHNCDKIENAKIS